METEKYAFRQSFFPSLGIAQGLLSPTFIRRGDDIFQTGYTLILYLISAVPSELNINM